MEKEHWAKALGAATKAEQEKLDELVASTYPGKTYPTSGPSSPREALGLGAAISTAYPASTVAAIDVGSIGLQVFQRLDDLEKKVARLERALTEAGKSEWDRFEELSR